MINVNTHRLTGGRYAGFLATAWVDVSDESNHSITCIICDKQITRDETITKCTCGWKRATQLIGKRSCYRYVLHNDSFCASSSTKIKQIIKENADAFEYIYNLGFSDKTISYYTKVQACIIELWRNINRLPAHSQDEQIYSKKAMYDITYRESFYAPMEDEESLFANTEFLEKFMARSLKEDD